LAEEADLADEAREAKGEEPRAPHTPLWDPGVAFTRDDTGPHPVWRFAGVVFAPMDPIPELGEQSLALEEPLSKGRIEAAIRKVLGRAVTRLTVVPLKDFGGGIVAVAVVVRIPLREKRGHRV
jgi:hypothetical protein